MPVAAKLFITFIVLGFILLVTANEVFRGTTLGSVLAGCALCSFIAALFSFLWAIWFNI